MPSLLGELGFCLEYNRYSKIAPCHLSVTMGIIIIEKFIAKECRGASSC